MGFDDTGMGCRNDVLGFMVQVSRFKISESGSGVKGTGDDEVGFKFRVKV